jgi:hypothetical protein
MFKKEVASAKANYQKKTKKLDNVLRSNFNKNRVLNKSEFYKKLPD